MATLHVWCEGTHTHREIKIKYSIKTYSTHAFISLAAEVWKSKAKSNKNILRGSLYGRWFSARVHRSYFKAEATQVSFLLFSTDSCGCARTPAGPGELPARLKETATCGRGFPLGSAWRQQLVLGSLGAGAGVRLGVTPVPSFSLLCDNFSFSLGHQYCPRRILEGIDFPAWASSDLPFECNLIFIIDIITDIPQWLTLTFQWIWPLIDGNATILVSGMRFKFPSPLFPLSSFLNE